MRPHRHVTFQLCGRGLKQYLAAAWSQVTHAGFRRTVGSVAQSNGRKHETIDLPMGVSGHIQLDLFSPHPSAINRHEPRELLVYLPPGPSIDNARTSTTRLAQDALAYLQSALHPTTSLVAINYRLGVSEDGTEPVRFPIPVHDVSTAFEFLTSSTTPSNYDQDQPAKICLFGSHIGGALATMLALTEPNSVHALATLEPMVDWVGLDEVVEQLLMPDSAKRHSHKAAATRYGVDHGSVLAAAEELIKLRARLFGTPSSYFDPFASPLLFLRAPGRDTPLGSTVGDRLVNEMGLDEYGDGDGIDQEVDGIHIQSSNNESQPSVPATPFSTGEAAVAPYQDEEIPVSTKPTTPPRRRKVLQRWPAVGNPDSVLLPHVQVFVQGPAHPHPAGGIHGSANTASTADGRAIDTGLGLAALKRVQGSELVELMRRACFLGRERGFAEERVLLHEGRNVMHNDDTFEMGRNLDAPSKARLGDQNSGTQGAANLHSAAAQWVHEIFQQD